jgi:hypothetical protein
MSKTESDDPTTPDSSERERVGLLRYRLVLGSSIVVYLGVAWAVISWLPPAFTFLAWIFVVFALSSLAYLLAGR